MSALSCPSTSLVTTDAYKRTARDDASSERPYKKNAGIIANLKQLLSFKEHGVLHVLPFLNPLPADKI